MRRRVRLARTNFLEELLPMKLKPEPPSPSRLSLVVAFRFGQRTEQGDDQPVWGPGVAQPRQTRQAAGKSSADGFPVVSRTIRAVTAGRRTSRVTSSSSGAIFEARRKASRPDLAPFRPASRNARTERPTSRTTAAPSPAKRHRNHVRQPEGLVPRGHPP